MMIDDRFHRRRDDDNNDRRDRCSQRASERASGRRVGQACQVPTRLSDGRRGTTSRSHDRLELQALRSKHAASELKANHAACCSPATHRTPIDRSIDHSVGRPSARSWTAAAAAAAAAAGLARSLRPWLHHERCPHGMSASMSACMSACMSARLAPGISRTTVVASFSEPGPRQVVEQQEVGRVVSMVAELEPSKQASEVSGTWRAPPSKKSKTPKSSAAADDPWSVASSSKKTSRKQSSRAPPHLLRVRRD